MALQYETNFRKMSPPPDTSASEIKVMIGWICKSTQNYLFMTTSAGSEMCLCTLVQALRLCTGRTAHRGSRGIALLFLGHGTRRGEGSALRPGRSIPPEKTRYPLYKGLGGPQVRSGQVGQISPLLGFDLRTVQWNVLVTFKIHWTIDIPISGSEAGLAVCWWVKKVKQTRCAVNIQILSYHLERYMFTLGINAALCSTQLVAGRYKMPTVIQNVVECQQYLYAMNSNGQW
jgi:hypothetical protein